MFLTTKGRYAVMAMVELASNGTGPTKLATIAERQEIDLTYLEQIFSQLRKHQLIRSVKGPGGGYILHRPSDQIRVSDIIMAVNEKVQITRCTNNSTTGCMKNGSVCATHDLWAALERTIYDFMHNITLATICTSATKRSSECSHTHDAYNILQPRFPIAKV